MISDSVTRTEYEKRQLGIVTRIAKLQVKLSEFEKRMLTIIELQNVALDKALASNDKRLDGMNEFRDSLKDLTTTFATKDGLASEIKGLRTELDILRRDNENLRSGADYNKGRDTTTKTYILAGISIIALVLSALSALKLF